MAISNEVIDIEPSAASRRAAGSPRTRQGRLVLPSPECQQEGDDPEPQERAKSRAVRAPGDGQSTLSWTNLGPVPSNTWAYAMSACSRSTRASFSLPSRALAAPSVRTVQELEWIAQAMGGVMSETGPTDGPHAGTSRARWHGLRDPRGDRDPDGPSAHRAWAGSSAFTIGNCSRKRKVRHEGWTRWLLG